MPTAEITVAFCNPAKEGKKNATIKTTDNRLFFVPLDMYPQFTPKGRYKIEYKDSTLNGNTLSFVNKVEVAAAAPIAKHQAAKFGVDDDKIAERIFVSGILQRAVQACESPLNVPEEVLVENVNKLRSVWRKTFGNPQKDADMNDEIPY